MGISRLTDEVMDDSILNALVYHYSGKAKINYIKGMKKTNPNLELKGNYLGGERRTSFFCHECKSSFDRSPNY